MERITRMLGLWGALAWGLLGTGVWAFNAVGVVTGDAEPSLDALLVALALTMTGLTIGITLNVVIGLFWSRRYPDNAMGEERAVFMLPMGLGLLGLVTAPILDGSLATMDWVLVVVGSLTSGFVLGTLIGTPVRRLPSTASGPSSSALTGGRR